MGRCWFVTLMVTMMLGGPAMAACAKSRLASGAPRFEIKGGEVRDRQTKLIWARCSVGMANTPKGQCSGERTLLNLEEAREAAKSAGRGWRLPTAEELSGLLDGACGKPTIDTQVFPDIEPDSEGNGPYWTATDAGLDDMAYYIDFIEGFSDVHSRGFQLNVRLVRDGQ